MGPANDAMGQSLPIDMTATRAQCPLHLQWRSNIGMHPTQTPLPPITGHEQRVRLGDRLFDHLVSNGKKPRRHGAAERLGGVEIDYEFELGWLKNWQVGGLGTPKYTACIDTGLAIRIRNTRAVAHETATRRKFTVGRNCRKPITNCESCYPIQSAQKKSVADDK